MKKNNNTGWYLVGGLALLCLLGHVMNTNHTGNNNAPVDSNAAPDTAASTDIILSPAQS